MSDNRCLLYMSKKEYWLVISLVLTSDTYPEQVAFGFLQVKKNPFPQYSHLPKGFAAGD